MSGGETEFLTEEEDIGFTMTSPTPNKVRVCPEAFPSKGDVVEEQMERRVASGEFRLASGEVDSVAMTEVMRQLIAQQKEEVDKEDVRKKLNRLQNYVLGDAKAEAVMARPAEIAGRHEATPATTQESKTGLGKVSDLISDKVKEKVEYLLCDMYDLELEEKKKKEKEKNKLTRFGTIINKTVRFLDKYCPDNTIDRKSDFYAQYGRIMVKHGYAEYAHDYHQERMAVMRLSQDIYDGSVRVKEIDGLDPLTDDENVDIDGERD